MKFKDYLIHVDACARARDYVGDKTLDEVWRSCERGDDMLWLLSKSNACDKRTLVKLKALCVEPIRHMLKDKRSTDALDAANAYGRGEIKDKDLAAYAAAYAAAAYGVAYADAYAYDAAAAAYADADAYAAYAAAYAAADDAYAAYAAAYAAYAAAYAYAYADADERMAYLKKCADMIRSELPSIHIEGVE